MYSNPSFDPQPLAGHDTKVVQAYFTALSADPDKPDLAARVPRALPAGLDVQGRDHVGRARHRHRDARRRCIPQLNALDLPQTEHARWRTSAAGTCGGNARRESFVESCNTTFARLGLELGDKFPPGMENGSASAPSAPPLDLDPGAVASIGPPPGSFQDNQPLFALAGIGQGDVATTPLQMALIAAAGIGQRRRDHASPTSAAEIRDANGDLVGGSTTGEWKTWMTPATAQAVDLDDGRGRPARHRAPPRRSRASRSPARPAPPRSTSGNPHAWFIAFAPAEAPAGTRSR